MDSIRRSVGLRLLAIVTVVIACGIVVRKCIRGEPKLALQMERRAPNGAMASLVAIAEGGATVGLSYRIEVKHAGGRQRAEWIWRSSDVEPLSIEWQGSDTVVVIVAAMDSTAIRRRIHTRQVAHVRAVTVATGEK